MLPEIPGPSKVFATLLTRELFKSTVYHLMLFETHDTNEVLTTILACKCFICTMYYIVFFENHGATKGFATFLLAQASQHEAMVLLLLLLHTSS